MGDKIIGVSNELFEVINRGGEAVDGVVVSLVVGSRLISQFF